MIGFHSKFRPQSTLVTHIIERQRVTAKESKQALEPNLGSATEDISQRIAGLFATLHRRACFANEQTVPVGAKGKFVPQVSTALSWQLGLTDSPELLVALYVDLLDWAQQHSVHAEAPWSWLECLDEGLVLRCEPSPKSIDMSGQISGPHRCRASLISNGK